MSKLELSDLLRLSILQHREMDDLRSPHRKTAYRRIMRQKMWDKIWQEAS